MRAFFEFIPEHKSNSEQQKGHMKLKRLLTLALVGLASVAGVNAAPLKIAYSDWPGYTIFEVAKQKGWFKDAGLDVELDWFEYLPSIDAFSADKVDAVMVVATDAMVTGSTGGKSKIIALLDYSEGSDMIIGAPGINSIKDLKNKRIGIEVTLVEHLLLLKALEVNGMSQDDVMLVNTSTDKTPETLASGKVSAVGAWYPISGQALKQVAGSKRLFTSAEAKGLIFDVLAVHPSSFAKHKEEWTKIAQIFYKCVDYLKDPATQEDAVKIMAAKVGADPKEYIKNIPGTHFLTLAEAKAAFVKGPGLDSIYGSMDVGNTFNLRNKVYKISQKPANYLVPDVVDGLK
jgi:NitT/TauT family transport system substrate-binding protein